MEMRNHQMECCCTAACCLAIVVMLPTFREWPFSLTGTKMKANLQGYEILYYLWRFEAFFEKFLGV